VYKEFRVTDHGGPATTPERWAENFAASPALGLSQRLAFRLDHRWRLIRRFVRPAGRVLDAGSGAGEWVAFLNENGFCAEGIDYSAELVARTRALYPRHRWQVGSIQQLPYEDGAFDAIISWGVIEHDESGPQAALAEFRRVLTKNGVAIVTVPVDTARQRRCSQVYFPQGAHDPRAAFFQYFMTSDELSRLVDGAGLRVVGRGLQRSPALALLAPTLTSRWSVAAQNRWNKAVRLGLWWWPAIMNMTYCIGRKSS
jgi:SAM-dependent methyltransferase